jgi:hypothetical protein
VVRLSSADGDAGRLYAEPTKLDGPDELDATNSLRARLAGVVRGRNVITAGSLHLIGLAEIRERVGGGWERVRETVHQQTRRIIEHHISPQDVYFPIDGDNYLLVFARLEKIAAEFVCAKITQELQRTLLGDDETCDVIVRTVVSEADGSLRIENAKLSGLLAGALAPTTASTPLGEAPAAAVPAIANPVILYRPVWDVRREVLSTYFSRRSLRAGEAPAARQGTPERLAALDLEALRGGTETLTDLYRNEFRLRMSFPVGFEALASPARFRSYLDLCRAIPEHLRKLVAFELVDLPAGVLSARLAELTAALRPYCGLVLATVDWWRADLSQFSNIGIRLVNAVIVAGSEERRALMDMDRFARDAGKAGLQSSVEGVRTSSLAVAARGSGIDFMSGDRIAPCLEIPNHMLRIGWSQIYFAKGRST